jgi:peptidoglycan hydrolase-like protein with peptidoglycan-binding domain
MRVDLTGVCAVAVLASLAAPFAAIAQTAPPTSAIAQFQNYQATPLLVRDIQFMLARLGIDPGPLDGVPRQLTNRAVRVFEEMHHLPLIDLQPGGIVPAQFLAELRTETARVVLGNAGKTDAGAPPAVTAPTPPPGEGNSPAPPPTAALAPPPPKPAPSDRFASCPYDPEDFRIGANQFTPDSFLKEGFDGSTARAVANLKDRLEEGRQLADRIGISALKDVQRQARVLQYFECRLKIEQASAGKS